MNELQQVLLVFAVVVIAGLYFLSRSRQTPGAEKPSPEQTSKGDSKDTSGTMSDSVQSNASKALNNLGEAHIPVSQVTENRFSRFDEHDQEINVNQGRLSFGEEFDLPEPIQTREEKAQETLDLSSVTVGEPVLKSANPEGGKHHVLVVEDPGMISDDVEPIPAEFVKPSFGIPREELGKSPGVSSGVKRDPEIFVITVMTAGQEFSMVELNQALLGVGLKFSEKAFYVKQDNMGNEIIKVANLLEPGYFPTDNLEHYTTPGVAMILELPTSVRAPAAMHDLIMMARKVSQRLEGRLYNMERQLIKESDLQSMRDAAVNYESEPL